MRYFIKLTGIKPYKVKAYITIYKKLCTDVQKKNKYGLFYL